MIEGWARERADVQVARRQESMESRKWAVVLHLFLLLIPWNGHAGVAAVADSEWGVADAEARVRALAGDALRLALDSDDCGLSQCAQRCSQHACSPTTAGPVPGGGFVRLPPSFRNFSSLSPEVMRSICAYSSLQFEAISRNGDRTLENLAFGTAEGVSRAYPGRAASPDGDCVTYDPRKQPWYILSTCVAKDLVVLLDAGQQATATFQSAKHVVTELFDTFTPADRVNVVTFDATSATLLQPTSVRARSRADLRSSFDVDSLVNTPSGVSNISLGLQNAITTFNSTSNLKIIVVLSDGYFAMAGSLPTPPLQEAVARLNSEGVVVFFFTLCPGDGENPPDPPTELRRLSCRLNSTVRYVGTEDVMRNPLWAIRPFFDYQASMRFRENVTFWSHGNVSTVSYPVFQNGTLYGVASVDVPVSSRDESIIKQRYVDPHVPAIRLSCQTQQVKLSQCTKLVDPGLRPLCGQNIYMDEPPASPSRKVLCCGSTSVKRRRFLTSKATRLRLGLGAVGIVLLLCVVAIVAYKCVVARSPVRRTKEDLAKASLSTCLYSYKELKALTRNFREDNKIGEGGIGEVYLGRNKDGSQVAVKKLTKSSKQVKTEFLAEVINLSKVQHRNLVKMRGFCVERKHRLLVYEYLEKKSLRQTLLGRSDDSAHIDWPTRFKIATDTARGLQYLHNELQPQIIHGDIKASNILLDSDLNAKISDFGLVKLCPDDKTNFTTNLAGTMGYMAPEYIMRGQLTEKVDVFSYGVLLMEIVTGKITTSRSRSGTMYFLLDEIRGAYLRSFEASDESLLLRLVDARLIGRFDRDEAVRVLKVALLCTSDRPSVRPSISEVILMLTESQDIPDHLLQDFVSRGDHSRRMSMQASPDLSNLQWWEDDSLDPPLLVERPSKRTEPVSTPTN